MLQSLKIKNFRLFKEIFFPVLKPVTLITGKNNTGKTSFLEAVAVYASKENIYNVKDLIFNELVLNFFENSRNFISDFVHLFYNREIPFTEENFIFISDSDKPQNTLSIGFIRDEPDNSNNENVYIKIQYNNTEKKFKINKEQTINLNYENDFFAGVFNFRYVKPKDIYVSDNAKLWDNIVLTDKENFVIDALRIIEPQIEKISFKQNYKDRYPIVKLSGLNTIIPLQTMGEGINRILNIILNIVNCENGYVLIDEMENGLHYKVQAQLWEIVFQLTSKLNTQIFVTTHSDDCLSSFSSILNKNENKDKGIMIRLDNKKGIIKPTEFSADELLIASQQFIELR